MLKIKILADKYKHKRQQYERRKLQCTGLNMGSLVYFKL